MMTRHHITLSEPIRAKIEAFRAANGLGFCEAVRVLLAEALAAAELARFFISRSAVGRGGATSTWRYSSSSAARTSLARSPLLIRSRSSKRRIRPLTMRRSDTSDMNDP